MHVVTYLLSLLFGISAAEDSCHCTCTKNNFVVSADTTGDSAAEEDIYG